MPALTAWHGAAGDLRPRQSPAARPRHDGQPPGDGAAARPPHASDRGLRTTPGPAGQPADGVQVAGSAADWSPVAMFFTSCARPSSKGGNQTNPMPLREA